MRHPDPHRRRPDRHNRPSAAKQIRSTYAHPASAATSGFDGEKRRGARAPWTRGVRTLVPSTLGARDGWLDWPYSLASLRDVKRPKLPTRRLALIKTVDRSLCLSVTLATGPHCSMFTFGRLLTLHAGELPRLYESLYQLLPPTDEYPPFG
ncbi:hypothetical protein FIBSPDRAFT_967208 [Athelia psychrophila]|uniref:Uncharacterized protein n=1 Tax=Athelia psychrophila TaxID=1759441 RepID=A0A167VYJ2_9AGAM|nr:hypothetical protein FIBSPDRAFT_967208 [Fibularhizoctonia sp. CBS 109695]